MAVAFLFLGHLLEYFGRSGIAFGEVFGKGHVDAAVFFLGGDRQCEHLPLCEFCERFHAHLWHVSPMLAGGSAPARPLVLVWLAVLGKLGTR